MPKPSTAQIQNFRQFQRRQLVAEKRYTKPFFTYLKSCYYSAARQFLKGESITIDKTKLEKILTRLYTQTTLTEAKHEYKEVIAPLEEGNRLQKKDFIDDLASLLSNNNRGLINIWRSLLDQFVQVRLTNKITMITRTTEERIARIIEEGMFEGQGQEEVARRIRKEASSDINKHRARSIARTETVVSANQGKYLAAKSSNLVLQKKWLPANDARTRRSHIDMLNREWIGLDEMFWIANADGYLEEALYPGADTLSASNLINCRCALITEVVRDVNGNLIRK